MAQALKKREAVKVEDTWRLEDIFATDEAWEAEFQSLKERVPAVAEFAGRVGESADTLLQVLQTQDELLQRINVLYTYAHMRYDQDTTNSHYQGMNDRARSLYTQIASQLSFFVPELLTVKEATLTQFLASNEQLAVYRHAIEEITAQRPHVLSASEEAILAQASEVMGASSLTFGALNNADLKFPTIKGEDGEEVEVTHGRYISFLESENRQVREDAFKAVYGTYKKYINTFASTLSSNVKKDNFYASVRKYNSARHAALSDNNIPEAVYDQLIATIHQNLPLLHRYIALRKKVLGVEELHMYDLFAPLVAEVDMKVTYDEAREHILEGLKPLGDDYLAILREGFNERWVDVHENVGKRSGAYSSGAYGTAPYILMNWQDNVNNLFTLAHEFGHSVHSYYTRATQPYVYGDYSIFVAEVASTTNEALLNDYLLKKETDAKKRLYLLNNYLETFRGTVFRQTMFAEFEHIIHQKAQEGVALTADLFTEIYYELNKKYYGDDIVIDEEIGLEWARIPHFYYNYYVFQYATGLSAAAALSKQILEEGAPAVERYISFLKAGSSDYPIEVLKKAGVDMATATPIEQACQVFEQYLTEMEQLLA